MRRVVAAGVIAVMGLVVVGCGDDEGGSSDDQGSSEMQATLRRSTLSETRRALRLDVHYESDHDVVLGAIQLRSPLFEPLEPEQRDARIRGSGPGAITMSLRFGDPRCDARADGPAQLVTDIDGEEMRVDIEEVPANMLATLHAIECEAQAVQEDVEMRLGESWVRTDPLTIEGELAVAQRSSGVTATIHEVEDNVIFTIGPVGPAVTPWAEVSDDQPEVVVPVVIHAARCDPHARIEYKRTFKFRTVVQMGDEDNVRVDLEAQGGAHRAMEDVLASCVS
jgi:hypothetical protein